MSNGAKITLGVVLFFLVLIGGTVGYVMSSKFTANKFENSLFAENENMRNVHSSGQNSLKMQSFAVKNYTKADLEKVEALVKKFDGKPNLLMMAVKENNQGLSPELHKEFMDAIQKYYVKWEVVQKSKISVTQEYRNYLNTTMKGSLASGMFNYPTKKANDIMEQVISSKETEKAFATGVDVATDLFKD